MTLAGSTVGADAIVRRGRCTTDKIAEDRSFPANKIIIVAGTAYVSLVCARTWEFSVRKINTKKKISGVTST